MTAPATTAPCSAAGTLLPPLLLLRRAGPLSLKSTTSTTETPAVAPQETTPFQTNRPAAGKGEGGSQKNINPEVHRSTKRQEEVSVADDYDLTSNPNEEADVSSSMIRLAGGSSFGVISTILDRPSTPETTSSSSGRFSQDSAVADQLEPQIAAFLAHNDEGNQQVEARIVAQKAPEEVLRQQMEEGEVIVADEDNENSSTSWVLKKKHTLLVFLLGIMSLLSIVACIGRVDDGRMISSSAETGDRLLEELRSLGAISDDEDHLMLFSDPRSPQSQALTWMKNDPIVMSPRRSMKDLLQRYVLAVLFYATNGSHWVWSQSFLSRKDVCSWNKEGIPFTSDYVYGVHCQSDGESVDGLVLSENSLTSQLPWELVLLTDLKTIDLGWNTLIGSIPTKLGQLLSLEYLDLRSNDLTGTIPTELGQLLSLEYLDFSSNDLTGTIPTELGRMLSLEHIWIDGNLLTGTIPTEFGTLQSLEWLVISGNQLTGTIPNELGQLLSLISFDIGSNDLSGAIPTELGQLLSLKWLVIGNNDLTGTIPTELGRLDSLEFLWIYQNQLSGRIPTELGQLLSLVNLDIRFNGVTGTIPTELGQPISLGYLDISSNQLSGTIPNELAGIGAYLEKFDASNNALTGSLDQSFCVANLTLYSLVVDCDQVECSCCYYCE